MAETDTGYRDELARQRTLLANERTLLAYIRTTLMLLAAGATAIKLFGDQSVTLVSGWLLVAIGTICGIVGALRFLKVFRALRRIEDSEQ